MIAHYNNQLLNSFALYVDHQICEDGLAYVNYSSTFQAVDNLYNGYYTYAAPTKQLICDISLTGATQFSGVYVGGTYRNIGQGGLTAINHDLGHVYFTGAQSQAISGNYSVKEFNVYLTEDTEEKLVFGTKYEVKPKKPQTQTPTEANTVFAPAIFIKTNSINSEPFCLGGTDKIVHDYRAVVISKSAFELDAACGIMQDMSRTYFNLVNPPFGALGYTGMAYNFTGLNVGTEAFIENVTVSRVSKNRGNSEFKDINLGIYAAFVDFEIHVFKNPRA